MLTFTWVYNSRAYLTSVSIPIAAALVAGLLPEIIPLAAPGVVIVLLLITAFLGDASRLPSPRDHSRWPSRHGRRDRRRAS